MYGKNMNGTEIERRLNLTKYAQKISCEIAAQTALIRAKRNSKRYERRKRNKIRYRRANRIRRCSAELYESIDCLDMEQPFHVGIKEVDDWQLQHQIAYWKSRSVSLDYENRMLHKYIRDLHVKQIQEGVTDGDVASGAEQGPVHEPEYTPKPNLRPANKTPNVEKELSEPPVEQVGKAEREKQKKLYGEAAAKITGMETAVQLNYDFYLEKDKPCLWPVYPLNYSDFKFIKRG